MKKWYFAITMLFVATVCMAQEETSAKNVSANLCEKPSSGSWGFTWGVTASSVYDVIQSIEAIGGDAYLYVGGIPSVSANYYFTDRWEARLGFKFTDTYSKRRVVESFGDDDSITSIYKDEEYLIRFVPGIAYHFPAKKNLDVYIGAELPIGWNTDKGSSSSVEARSKEKVKTKNVDSQFVIGGGCFVGIRGFIKDLPLSIGVEAGFGGFGHYDLDTKYYESKFGGDLTISVAYYFQ